MNAATKILAGSHIATTSAERLVRQGIDAARLAQLIGPAGCHVGAYRLKLITPDPESPDNFGVLVRQRPESDKAT